jgi:hypothetical protein
VAGVRSNAVNWRVNGVAGGNSSVGTITTAGVYTAPASVPSPSTVTVTVVPQAGGSSSAAASVTIAAQGGSAAPSGGGGGGSVDWLTLLILVLLSLSTIKRERGASHQMR